MDYCKQSKFHRTKSYGEIQVKHSLLVWIEYVVSTLSFSFDFDSDNSGKDNNEGDQDNGKVVTIKNWKVY